MFRTVAVVAASLVALSGPAMAQDAASVIANAQKALGDVRSITYSGTAKDVSFQQCGANATQMTCQGPHDPMRPITSYVRVIDLAAPASGVSVNRIGLDDSGLGNGHDEPAASCPVAGLLGQDLVGEVPGEEQHVVGHLLEIGRAHV